MLASVYHVDLSAVSGWAAADADALEAARRRWGHSQEECAVALGVTQGTVSKWERLTARPRRALRDTIREYCASAPEGARRVPESAAAPTHPVSDSFETVISELTGSRPLSDTQARVRDGILERFRKGPRLEIADVEVFRWLVTFHGLIARPPPGEDPSEASV